MRALGVLGADRLSSWPDRQLGVEVTTPQLVTARPGVLVELAALPLTLVARADLGEAARPRLDDRALPLVDAVLDDLYAAWRPAGALLIVAGRARVPWSRSRQVEELFQPLGVAPFVVDRVAPDRRWGASAGLELGALTLHGGAWADLDALEPRLRRDDPSRGGRLALALAGRLAPGSAIDPEAPRPAVGLGALVRVAEDGTARLDGALSLELSWRWLSALVEGLGATGDGLALGGHATVQARIARVDLGLRAERDPGAEGGGQWASAAEIGWNVTRDRKNRVSVVGWLRRDLDRGTPFDGIVVFLQASL